MVLAILNFLKDVHFADSLDFVAFSIISCKITSTKSNKLKIGTVTPMSLVNTPIKEKAKQITFTFDFCNRCGRICPISTLFWNLSSNLQIFRH